MPKNVSYNVSYVDGMATNMFDKSNVFFIQIKSETYIIKEKDGKVIFYRYSPNKSFWINLYENKNKELRLVDVNSYNCYFYYEIFKCDSVYGIFDVYGDMASGFYNTLEDAIKGLENMLDLRESASSLYDESSWELQEVDSKKSYPYVLDMNKYELVSYGINNKRFKIKEREHTQLENKD